MLVVAVAVVALLALFPRRVAPSTIRAISVVGGNDGRQIQLGLFTANIDRIAKRQPEIWPKQGEFKTSTEFFRRCLQNGDLDRAFTVRQFGGMGLPRPAGTNAADLASGNNAWCVTCDLGERSDPATPLLFTRNFTGGGTLDSIRGLSGEELPHIKDRFGVVVTYGGGVKILDGREIRRDPQRMQELFNPRDARNSFLRP